MIAFFEELARYSNQPASLQSHYSGPVTVYVDQFGDKSKNRPYILRVNCNDEVRVVEFDAEPEKLPVEVYRFKNHRVYVNYYEDYLECEFNGPRLELISTRYRHLWFKNVHRQILQQEVLSPSGVHRSLNNQSKYFSTEYGTKVDMRVIKVVQRGNRAELTLRINTPGKSIDKFVDHVPVTLYDGEYMKIELKKAKPDKPGILQRIFP
ncbi:hypothetical protein [Polystyrenella longa]|nr:hypothetical protein [Polystyrenella longa]